jgi:hypothetical protein
MSGDWRGTLWTLLVTFCIVIIRCTESFCFILYYTYSCWASKKKYLKVSLITCWCIQGPKVLRKCINVHANWIGHILRRNCRLKQVIEGKIKGRIAVIWRRGRRRRKLPDDLKEMTGYSHLKEYALYRTMWRDRFGRGFERVVRLLNECISPCTLAPGY